MDVSPVTGTESETPLEQPPLPDPPPSQHHQRRHLRYASPDVSTPSSPRLFLNSNHHSHHNLPPPQPTMISSQELPAVASSSHSPAPSSHPEQDQPTSDGQNHDRMETDEDSDDSRSTSGTETPEQSDATTDPAPLPSLPAPPTSLPEAEAMDTTPDHSPAPEVGPPPPAPHEDLVQTNATTVRMSVTANIGTNTRGLPTLLDNPSLSFNMDGINQPTGEVHVQISNAALEEAREGRQLVAREESVHSRTRRERRAEERERDDDEDRDDDSDDSSDEEDHPYWASFKEDTSAPDEEELKVIEKSSTGEVSAIDHEHWEKSTFEPLDDPEYIPSDTGRISWTVKGVHGTPEKPNKERIMKSPSVRIGDFYWNIKYFPRGNDGTEQVSVYIECSPTPYEEAEAKGIDTIASKSKDDSGASEAVQLEQDKPLDATSAEDGEAQISTTPASVPPAEPLQSSQTLPKDEVPKPEAPWRVAAQIACVMYNPDEPRVNASQKSCHGYYNDNSDWGWTRFHGPWDDLHMRKKYQRQALLRNDTISFTAYIRIVKDATKALWWHPPKEKPLWNSIEMTGVRAFECQRSYQSSNLVAALSAWLHLRPVLQAIENVPIPNAFAKPKVRPRPILNELRDFINEDGDYSKVDRDLPIDMLAALIDSGSSPYGIRKMDVIALWETLRQRLNFEAANVETVQQANGPEHDLFQNVLLLKQPDPFGLDISSRKYQVQPRDTPQPPLDREPTSVQDIVDLTSFVPEKRFRVWESFPQQQQDPPRNPEVLQIELHRQHYDQEARKWKKLGHRIALNDQILLNHGTYTLYGIIVHTGSLESQEYYSVIRPAGPDTRWIKYAGENSHRKVSILTTKQAVTAHEGSGKPELKAGEKSDKKRENVAVAYVAMYVRTECLPTLLATPFDRRMLDERKAQSLLNSAPGAQLDPTHVVVSFYSGDVFLGNKYRDIFDPWSRRVLQDCQDTFDIVLPKETTLRQVKNLLDSQFAKISDQMQDQTVKIWLLNATQVCPGTSPAFLPFERHVDLSMTDLTFSEGCRFWIATDNEADTRRLIQHLRSANVEELMEALRKEAPTSTSEEDTGADPRPDGAVAIESTGVLEEGERLDEEAPTVDATDVVMSDAQDSTIEPPPPPPPPAVGESNNSSEAIDDDEKQQSLCFVKIFDWEQQALQSVASFEASSSVNAMKEVKKVLGISQKKPKPDDSNDMEQDPKELRADEKWDIYHEVPGLLDAHALVGSHFSLGDFYGDGACFIAQRRPTLEQKQALQSAGKPADAPAFLHHLKVSHNLTFDLPYQTSSYFGSSYFSGAQAYSLPHGPGTLITMTGDAYTGPFASGRKAGAGGKMIFANKDIYEGEWADDEPHGKGVMTYEKTGNVYEGGWKKGKRHGEGTMHFKVADEQEKLCQVCYEEEMNSLFYPCGHVCACEGCARQVDQCMVCRDRVRGVVKVRWTV